MGVDAKLFISSRWELEEIKTVIEREFKTKVKFENTYTPNYMLGCFSLENGENRSMSIFINYEHNGFTGILLSLGANRKAVEVMTALAQVFGGYLQESDCVETCQGFAGALSDQDGLRFWSRYAIVNGIDPKDIDALAMFIENKKATWKG